MAKNITVFVTIIKEDKVVERAPLYCVFLITHEYVNVYPTESTNSDYA